MRERQHAWSDRPWSTWLHRYRVVGGAAWYRPIGAPGDDCFGKILPKSPPGLPCSDGMHHTASSKPQPPAPPLVRGRPLRPHPPLHQPPRDRAPLDEETLLLVL